MLKKFLCFVLLMCSTTKAQVVGSAGIAIAPASQSGQLYPALGWTLLPNTNIESVAPNFTTYPVAGNCGWNCNLQDWSSAWNDTKRDRMVMWGGGHQDYNGNEVYVLNLLTGTLTRATNPTYPYGSCTETNSDGTANVRHTYDTMVYVGGPTVTNNPHDFYFQYSGAKNTCGFSSTDYVTLQPNLTTWTDATPTQGTNSFPSGFQGLCADYDPISDRVYVMDIGSFGYYDPTQGAGTGTFHYLSTLTQVDYLQTCIVDRDNRVFIAFGDSKYYKFDLTQTNPAQQVINSASGCGTVAGTPFVDPFPLAAYYPYRRKIEMIGGTTANTIYEFDTVAGTCTTIGESNGPAVSNNSGQETGSKLFGYYPDLGVFALGPSVRCSPRPTCSGNTGTAGVLRLDTGAGDGVGGGSGSGLEYAFSKRAAASGNLGSAGFDTNGFINTSGQLNNLGNCDISGETLVLECFYDTSISNSGAGSMRLDCPGLTGADCSGDWNFWLDPSGHTNYYDSTHQNVDVYWQFHVRGNTQQFTTDWEALVGSSSKHFIFHQGSPSFQTCGKVEITEVQQGFNTNTGTNNQPFPTGYTNCGGNGFIDQTSSYNIPGSVSGTCTVSDPCEQQGPTTTTPYWAQHPAFTGAFRYSSYPNTWLVEYWHVHLGTPGNANSSIDAWIAPVGQPLVQFLHQRNFTFPIDSGCPGNAPSGGECFYNVLTFLLYMTAKNSGVNHNTGSMWIDELITSTSSIPAPYGPTPVPN